MFSQKRRAIGFALSLILGASGCLFTPPAISEGPTDLGNADGGSTDFGPADLGELTKDAGDGRDAQPDLSIEVDVGVDMGQPEDTGPVNQDMGPPDTGLLDTGVEPPIFSYTPRNFDPNNHTPSAAVVLDCDARISIEEGQLTFDEWCGQPQPAVAVLNQAMAPAAFLLAMDAFQITAQGALRIIGSLPVILAVYGDAELDGPIDTSRNVRSTENGAGCLYQGQDGMSSNGRGGGGGGGGSGTVGGNGGDGGNGASGGQGGNPNGGLEPLFPGCEGGNGAQGDEDGGGGGEGGGAIQISAAGTLFARSLICSAGGRGRGGGTQSGGGGGGAGGTILLEGESFVTVADAIFAANGGGGGQGGRSSQGQGNGEGANGTHGQCRQVLFGAQGGGGGIPPEDGRGGTGGHTNPPGSGDNSGNGGGGGGGAAGRIHIESASGQCMIPTAIGPDFSPDPSSSCPNFP